MSAAASEHPRRGLVPLAALGAVAGAASGGLTAFVRPEMTRLDVVWWFLPGASFALAVGGAMSAASRAFREVVVGWVALALFAWPAGFWIAVAGARHPILAGAAGGFAGGALIGVGNGLSADSRRRAFWITALTGGIAGALLFPRGDPDEENLSTLFVAWQALAGAAVGACVVRAGTRAAASAAGTARSQSLDGGPLR